MGILDCAKNDAEYYEEEILKIKERIDKKKNGRKQIAALQEEIRQLKEDELSRYTMGDNTIIKKLKELADKMHQGQPFIKNEGIIFCHHCHVPLDVHGTCCGWLNAASKTNTESVITDSRHPGFGQNLNTWKNKEIEKCTKE